MAKKNKYVQDYEVFEVSKNSAPDGKKGKVQKKLVYKGNHFSFTVSESTQKRIKLCYVGLMLLICLFFAGIGMLNNDGSRKIYVVFPYVFMSLPVFYGMMGAVKLFMANQKMTRVEYDHSVIRLRKSSVALLVLSITCVLGEIGYMVKNQMTDSAGKEYLFLAGTLLIAGISFLMTQLQNRYVAKEIKAD